ncbi:MAG: hypothetical protein SFU98_20415 [Leptospiraceae bacterium]|nr:hypothetical protein [Leptospiraceae bacterium]
MNIRWDLFWKLGAYNGIFWIIVYFVFFVFIVIVMTIVFNVDEIYYYCDYEVYSETNILLGNSSLNSTQTDPCEDKTLDGFLLKNGKKRNTYPL